MAQHEHTAGDHGHSTGAAQRKRIWMVFWLLFAVTALEFIVAFTVDRGMFRNMTFILMTIFKAFYIVAEFMHLKHEIKTLILTILLPMIFVCWLILALLVEGSFYNPEWGWFN